MKFLLSLFLIFPFFCFSQNLEIYDLKNIYNCHEGLFELNYRADLAFDLENKFELNFTDAKGVVYTFTAHNNDNSITLHLPDQKNLPIGTYSVSVNSTSPQLKSNELKEQLTIIDKNYKPEISLTAEENYFDKEQNVNLKFNYTNPEFPLHLQLNAYDEIDLAQDSKEFIVSLPATRTTQYKILNVGIGGCSLEQVEYPEIVRVILTSTAPSIVWEPKSKNVCDGSSEIISNRFKVYGDVNSNPQYTVTLINRETGIEYLINHADFYVTRDRFELPLGDIKEIPSGKSYYFKIVSDSKVESDELGPFHIENLPVFNILGSKEYTIEHNQNFKFAIDIKGTPPWNFTINNIEYTSETNRFDFRRNFITAQDNPFYYITNAHAKSGACANINTPKTYGLVTLKVNAPF